MVVDPGRLDQLRAGLHARIKQATEARRAARVGPQTCVHTWETFKQTVTVENDRFTGSAYLVVRGCRRCHAKELLNYVVGGHR
ncbi:hypothetical protein C5C71_01885 [Rathayibacter sp. AY1C1]|nr:hypothetical protein C5C71_01885 [Rathayibacter sp. AY1C1]